MFSKALSETKVKGLPSPTNIDDQNQNSRKPIVNFNDWSKVHISWCPAREGTKKQRNYFFFWGKGVFLSANECLFLHIFSVKGGRTFFQNFPKFWKKLSVESDEKCSGGRLTISIAKSLRNEYLLHFFLNFLIYMVQGIPLKITLFWNNKVIDY